MGEALAHFHSSSNYKDLELLEKVQLLMQEILAQRFDACLRVKYEDCWHEPEVTKDIVLEDKKASCSSISQGDCHCRKYHY